MSAGSSGRNINTHQNSKSQNDSSLENNSGKSFFIQLKSFCTSLQNQYQDIITQFEAPAGSNPRNYDRGLKVIKSEVANVKKLTEDTRENIYKIQQFGYFVESTKDLINSQKEDIQRMEKYLIRYGYTPPEALEEVETNYDSSEDKKRIDEGVEYEALKSPELSEIGRKVIEGKALPILTKLKPAIDKPLIVHREKVVKTPIQVKNTKWYMTPTPDVSSRRKVEKWIECVEAAAAASITPVCVKNIKNTLLFEEEEEESFCDSSKHGIKNKSFSPKENFVKSVKASMFNDVATTTPEDPIVSSVSSSFVKRNNNFKDATPEEPILSQSKYQNTIEDTTPEEPLLLSQTRYQKGRERINTSHSSFYESVSQLSDITLKVLNQRQMNPPKNDKVVNVPSHNYSKLEKTEQNMEPESPKLSDVTLKVLRKHSKAF